MGEGHRVGVKLEGIGVRQGDGEHRHIVGVDERVVQLWQPNQG